MSKWPWPDRLKMMTCSVPASSARRAASIAPLMACALSGAGTIPSERANVTAAEKTSFCRNASARTRPSSTSWETIGAAPIVSQLVLDGLVRAEAFGQTDVFAAAIEFARSEAIIPAPESAHAIKGAIDAARRADEAGTEQVIIFNLSGHGHFDMGAYDAYLHGRLEDFELPEAEIQRALKAIEDLPKPAGVSV